MFLKISTMPIGKVNHEVHIYILFFQKIDKFACHSDWKLYGLPEVALRKVGSLVRRRGDSQAEP